MQELPVNGARHRVDVPDTVQVQIEGGVVFGITGALYGEVTLKNGRVQQSNFSNYRILRMNESPAIEVHLVRSTESPGGIGEPGTRPPLRLWPTPSSRRPARASAACRCRRHCRLPPHSRPL